MKKNLWKWFMFSLLALPLLLRHELHLSYAMFVLIAFFCLVIFVRSKA